MCMKTKSNFKFITLSIILLLICFTLSGCAQVNFITYLNSNGTINEYVYLVLDSNALMTHGYNPLEVKNSIRLNSQNIANNLLTEYQSKLAAAYSRQEISLQEFNEFNNGVAVIEHNWENDEYIIGLQFENATVYRQYYRLLDSQSSKTSFENSKIIEKAFYTKTYYYGSTGYSDYSIFNSIYNYYTQTVFHDISPQEASLNYSYAVNSSRFHSNADSVSMDINGNYLHTWNVNPEEEREIYFYTITANRSMWIIVCLIIGLTISLILCIIGLCSYIKTKRKIIK